MLASNLTEKEMRQDVRRLIKNISRRVKRIESAGDTASQFSAIRFRELEKNLPRKLTDLSKQELKNLHRDLRYLQGLKTSYLKGASKAKSSFENIREHLGSLSKKSQDKFWEIYGKLYNQTSGLLEKFKYEIFETNIDYIFSGEEVDKAVFEIEDLFRETIKELGSAADEESISKLFLSKLSTLRK